MQRGTGEDANPRAPSFYESNLKTEEEPCEDVEVVGEEAVAGPCSAGRQVHELRNLWLDVTLLSCSLGLRRAQRGAEDSGHVLWQDSRREARERPRWFTRRD